MANAADATFIGPADASPSGLVVGQEFAGRYQVQQLLGAGGMGAVYKVWDRELGVAVALKTIRPELAAGDSKSLGQFEHRFKQELLAARQVTHTNVVRIFDLGESGGVKFITMAYISGTDAASLLESGALPFARTLHLARQLTSGLAAAHDVGVIHRDLKPQNLLIDATDHLWISDFGLAKSVEPGAAHLTQTGEFLGTAGYISPEQVKGKPADQRSDLYAVGLILFEMATGRMAFSGASALELMYQRLSETPKDPRSIVPDLPEYFSRIVSKCLARDPNHRYQTAHEVLADLDRERVPTQAHSRESLVATLRLPVTPVWTRGAMAALLLLVLAAGIVIVTRTVVLSRSASEASLPPSSERRLVAVLPFRVVGDEGTLGYLATGVGEALSAKLFQLKDKVAVASPRAVDRANLEQPIQDIGRELGVNLIVTGTVQGSKDKIRIIAALEDVVTGERVWTDDRSGVPDDLLTLQDQLYVSLASSLRLESGNPNAARPTERLTEDIEAYDLYLKGRNALRGRQDPKNVQAAIAFFEDAVKRDARFALAYTGIADASLRMFSESRDRVWAEKALHAAERAQALDNSLPEVHYALGSVYTAIGRTAESIAQLERALELAPNSDEGHRRLANAYLAVGRGEEAIAGFERAIAVNPYYWQNHSALGAALLQLGSYEKAIAANRRVIELEPDNVTGHNDLGAAHLSLGNYDDAAAAFERALKIQPTPETYTNLGTALFFNRQYRQAVPMFEKSVELSPNAEQWVGNLADGYRWAGQTDKALATYDRAISLAYKELQVNPRSLRVKRHLATYYAKKGDPAQARQFLDDALASNAANVNVLYTAAVVHALAHRTAEAVQAVRSAVEAGYSAKLIEADPEFATLRSDPQFAEATKSTKPSVRKPT